MIMRECFWHELVINQSHTHACMQSAGYPHYLPDIRTIRRISGYISRKMHTYTFLKFSTRTWRMRICLLKSVQSAMECEKEKKRSNSHMNICRESTFRVRSVVCRLPGVVSKWSLPYIRFRQTYVCIVHTRQMYTIKFRRKSFIAIFTNAMYYIIDVLFLS